MFEFCFEINMEDFYEYTKHHTYCTPANRRSLLRLRVIYPLYFLMMAFLFAFVFQQFNTSTRFIITIGSILYVLLYLIFFKKLTDRRIRKSIARNAQDGKLFDKGPHSYRFEESAFTSATDSQTLNSSYSNLERIDVGNQAIYLYVTAVKAHIFPNHIFTNEEEKSRFVSFIEGKINEIKKEKTP